MDKEYQCILKTAHTIGLSGLIHDIYIMSSLGLFLAFFGAQVLLLWVSMFYNLNRLRLVYRIYICHYDKELRSISINTWPIKHYLPAFNQSSIT